MEEGVLDGGAFVMEPCKGEIEGIELDVGDPVLKWPSNEVADAEREDDPVPSKRENEFVAEGVRVTVGDTEKKEWAVNVERGVSKEDWVGEIEFVSVPEKKSLGVGEGVVSEDSEAVKLGGAETVTPIRMERLGAGEGKGGADKGGEGVENMVVEKVRGDEGVKEELGVLELEVERKRDCDDNVVQVPMGGDVVGESDTVMVGEPLKAVEDVQVPPH